MAHEDPCDVGILRHLGSSDDWAWTWEGRVTGPFPDDRPGTAGDNPANEPADLDALAHRLAESDAAAEELGLTDDQARYLIERKERMHDHESRRSIWTPEKRADEELDAAEQQLADHGEPDLELDAAPNQRDSRAVERLDRDR